MGGGSSKEYVIKGVGKLPLERPSEDLKPFFRQKYRTLFRFNQFASGGRITKDQMEQQVNQMLKSVPEQDQAKMRDFLVNDMYATSLFFGRNSITEDEYVDEHIKRTFASPQARKKWIDKYLPILRGSFAPIDLDKNGVVDMHEFEALWRAYNYSESHIEQYNRVVFNNIDSNHDGVISVNEYLFALLYFMLCSEPRHPLSMLLGHLVD